MNINKSGLYMTISRINHSCAPNVIWSWIKGDKSRSVKRVRVCREIKEGEEILASYCVNVDLVLSKDERQKMLSNWNFTCNCEVCSLTGDELMENEKVRNMINYYHKSVPFEINFGSKERAHKIAKKKVEYMESIEKEVIVHLPSALMECCETAAYCNLPSSSTAELRKKAKDMAELFADTIVYNYVEMEKRIVRNCRLLQMGGRRRR